MSADGTVHAATLLAQAGGYVDPATGALVPPLVASSTFERRSGSGLVYLRDDNPVAAIAEDLLATLEGGSKALLFSSGMAAATAVFEALPAGAGVLAPEVMYWNLRRWLRDQHASGRLRVGFVDMSDVGALAAALDRLATALVWIETPANPLWTITDIAAAVRLAHAAGARVAVDSTAATPLATRPLSLGADLVVHSASKYLNGHSDLVAGGVVTACADEVFDRLRALRHDRGAVLGPFEAWLLLRGMRTLALRFERACASAMTIARHLAGDPRVVAVLYPGLADHPGHRVAACQMQGRFGGMLSIRVRGGGPAAAAVAAATRIFKQATSLGGVESLIEHRKPVEGPDSPVPDDLLRLSVGIEDPADLLADLDAALASAEAAGLVG
ncbi:Cystathionine gamma-synthase [bacterium HR40]|nr:Cystathionine gamma-synthase [bacterium HR40]